MEEKIEQQIKDITNTTLLGPTGPEMQPVEQPAVAVQEDVEQPEQEGFVSTGMTRTIYGPDNYSVTDTRTEKQEDVMGPTDATVLSGSSGTVRPLDGSMGSPYYLDTSAIYPNVEPYTLQMPDLDLEFRVSSLNPSKAAWEAATKYAGVPADYYTGYYYSGPREDTTKEAIQKSIFKIPGVAADVLTWPAVVAGYGSKAVAEQVGDNMLGQGADAVGDWLVNVWNTKERWGRSISQYSQLDSDKTGWGGLFAQAPQALAYTFGSLALMRAGLSPTAASLMTEMTTAGYIADALDEKGYAPTDIFLRSLTGGLASSAINAAALRNYSSLNSFISPIATKMGQTTIRKGVMDAAVRYGYSEARRAASSIATDFAHHTLRRWSNRGAATLLKGGAEMGTETAQSLVQSAFSAAISPESWRTELDQAIGEGVLGLAAGVAMASPDIATEFRRIRAEKDVSKAVTEPLVKALLDGRAAIINDLKQKGMPESKAIEVVDYLTDHTLEEVEQKLTEIFTGELDKFNNADQAEFSKRIAPLLADNGISEQQLQDLDTRVDSALQEVKSFTQSDKQFIKGLFRGMANILAYAGVSPSSIQVPTFTEVATETEMGWYDPNTNTFNINPNINAYGTSLFDTRGLFKEGAEQNTLSPRHRAILHEYAHLLDVAVGMKGFGRFFEQYYATIQEQFGKQTAKTVRNIAEQSMGGDRTSKRPKTASETHPSQTTEYFAQALSRATAQRIMKAVGAQGKVADFVAYANLVINGMMQIGTTSEAITEYMGAIQSAIQSSTKILKQLVQSQLDYMGRDKTTRAKAMVLQSKLKRFLDADVTSPEQVGLSADELFALTKVLKSFLGGEGVQIAQQVFDGVDTEALNAKASQYLAKTFEADEVEFEDRKAKEEARAKAKEKQAKAAETRKAKALEAGADPNDLPIFDQMPDAALPSKATGFSNYTITSKDGTKTVVLDNKDGWGATGITSQAEENYNSITVEMPIDEFLKLASPLSSSQYEAEKGAFVKAIEDGEKFAMPYFSVDVDYNNKTMSVVGHEGRHRLMALKESGFETIPVVIYGYESFKPWKDGSAEVKANPVGWKITSQDDGSYVYEIQSGNLAYRMPESAMPSRATGFTVDDSAYDIPEIMSDEDVETEQKNKQFDMRINTKIDGRTLLQDIEETAKHLDDYRPKAEADTAGNKIYKWLYTQDMLTNVDEVLRVAGGEEFANKYGVVKAAQKSTDRLFEYHFALDAKLHKIIGKGIKYDSEKWRFRRDAFLADCAVRDIEAVRRDPVLTDRQVPVTLNAFEAMTVYRMLKQTANQANVRINNVFLGKAQQIAEQLTEEEKAYADAMAEVMGIGWDKYIEIAVSEYEGRQYNKVDNYTPIYDAINNLFVGDLSQNSFSRTTQDRDIEPVDMRMMFNVYMGRIANYEGGYYQKLRRLKDMVAFNPDTEFTGRMTEEELQTKRAVETESRKLRLRLESVLGKSGADVFVRGIEDSLENHAKRDVPNGLIGATSRSIVTSLLAFNPLSLPKNATNISVFSGMGIPRYSERFLQGLSKLSETWKLMMSIPGLKQRLGGEGIDEHLDSSNVGSDSFTGIMMGTKGFATVAQRAPWLRPLMANMTAFSALAKRFGMKIFMQTGDAIANIYGAYPLYLHATEDLGMTHEEAGQYVMQAINDRQSSSNRGIKTFGVRRFNRQGLGGLTAFSTEQVNKFRDMIRDWAMADRGDIARKQAVADIAAILSTFVLFSLISAGAGDLFSDDEDVKSEAQTALLREALQSLMGLHPLGGSFGAPAIMYLTGIGQPSGISIPATSYAISMIKEAKEGDLFDFMVKAAGVTGTFVGLDRIQNSWEGALDAIFGDTVEQVAAGYRRLWGRSESYAKNRTGYKEPVENEDE